MGKLFGRKRKYSEEEYEDEMFEDDDIDDEEDDDYEMDDDEEDDDDEYEMDDEEDDEYEIDDEEDDDDEYEIGDEEDDDDEYEMNDDEDEDEIDDGGLDDDEAEDDDEDNEVEDDEDDRRAYRHRRRVRNQIIAYSVVFVFLLLLFAGCITIGKNIVGSVKAKKLAEEQERLQAEQEAEAAQEVVIDAPETMQEGADEPSEEEYLREIMDGYLSEMPLADKVAGLFVVRPEAITGVSTATQAGDGTREALTTYAVGGLVYFEKNILDREQIQTMLANTASMSRYPIFLAVDEEGGSASRVAGSGIDVAQVGDMAAIGESGDAAQAQEAGTTIGSYLSELGFNLDFAPVADVADAGSSELGDRVFGSDAQTVGAMVSSVVEGIEGAGLSSCLKHFPGIGEAEGDTHDGRVETARTLDEMRNSEFIPFQAGIDAGADFVMVSHITASAVDEESVPSSLSKVVVTDVLRNELGFQGVVITDALDMSAITEYYTSEEAAVMAIEAGADMLLMPEDFEAAYNALLTAVQEGTISEERINESLERIYRVKARWKMKQMQEE